MATITSASSGNFSNTATWVGGVVPGAGDDAVAATGHVVVIDFDVTVLSFQQTGTGKFTLGDGRNVTGDVIANAGTFTSGGTVDVICGVGESATINGDVTGSATTNTTVAILLSGTGTVFVVGDISGAATGQLRRGIGASSNGTIDVLGNISGGAGTQNYAIQVDGAGSVAATGNVSSAGNTSVGILHTGTSGSITVTGNVNSNASNNGPGILATGASTSIYVTGNLNAGVGTADCSAVSATGSSNTVTLTGTASGAAAPSATTFNFGIRTTGANATINVLGAAVAGGLYGHGISSSSITNGVIFTGDITDSPTGTVAINTRLFRITDTSPSGVTTYANTAGFPAGTPVSRVSPDNVTGMAQEVDVRLNTVYGFNSELTGQLAVPPPQSVAAGVPTDNTVGTGGIDQANLVAVIGAQIAAASSTPSVP
jgi:hypothetical protein